MASNFRISFHRNKHNLKLTLQGDLDGSSCHQLINAIMKKNRKFKTIIIDTGNLGTVYPFAQAIWEKSLSSLSKHNVKLAVIGAHQGQLSL